MSGWENHFCRKNGWRVGDLVLWDNRCTLHRRDPFDAAGDAPHPGEGRGAAGGVRPGQRCGTGRVVSVAASAAGR
ncbi:TauD/TfdA family dioxygenase [Roseicella aquatilis]|uniref:TauD/TfdA family dioxygenase n=1 Tax=Roseicella aquatilis TaxID=2527868 RepID=UPI001F0E4012|nr:TauD/TfdA family dioxygenase [Roseicella aquatilis]